MFLNNCENNEMYQKIYQKIEHDSNCCTPAVIGPTHTLKSESKEIV